MKTNSDAVSALNTLIEYCKDGEYGYKTAAEDSKNASWKSALTSYSNQRGQFAKELELQVQAYGKKPDDSSSITGALHRTWIDIKSAIESGDEKAILAECARGDEAAVKKYEEVLENTILPDSVNVLVRNQYGEIKKAYQHVKNLAE